MWRDRLESIERDILGALAKLEGCHDEHEPLRKLLVKAETVVVKLLNPKFYIRPREIDDTLDDIHECPEC